VTDLAYFTDWTELALAGIGLLMGVLLIIWWRQQSKGWYTLVAGTLALAAGLSIASHYLFVLPPHFAGCPQGCPGRTGFPLPFAVIDSQGHAQLYPLDFWLNLLLIWLALLTGSTIIRFLQEATDYRNRSARFRIFFLVLVIGLPWAFLPRFADPPEANVRGEELRLTINARRAAQHTYNVTGLWVHRLALEEIRYTPMQVLDVEVGLISAYAEVCLRGYTFFYLPWRNYLIVLDRTGVTPLGIQILPQDQNCWRQ
jgi:hypothetical protein